MRLSLRVNYQRPKYVFVGVCRGARWGSWTRGTCSLYFDLRGERAIQGERRGWRRGVEGGSRGFRAGG